MDLRQLRYFLAVVEHGSFTRAASMTGRTQQALSKGIQALEQQLGAPLFERGARTSRLTTVGRLLLDHARAADESLLSFERRLEEWQTGTEGEVRIGTGPSSAASLVAPAVLALRRQWPRIGVRVSAGILPELLPALLAREIDVIVALDTVTDIDARITRDLLMTDDYRVMAAADHPLAGKADIGPAELLQHPWILGLRLGAVEQEFRQRFIDAGLSPPAHPVESSSVEFMRALMRSRGYLTLLPTLLAQAELRTGEWLRLPVPGFIWQRPLMLYIRAGEPQATPLLRLLQALRNAAADARRPGG